jgi:hypothetical protein
MPAWLEHLGGGEGDVGLDKVVHLLAQPMRGTQRLTSAAVVPQDLRAEATNTGRVSFVYSLKIF